MAEEEKDITMIEPLIVAMAKARDAKRHHKAQADKYERLEREIQEQVAKVLGSAQVGVVRGQAVIRHTLSSRFSPAQFRQENPDLYQQVVRMEEKEVVDTDLLRSIDEDMYKRYLVPVWTNNYEVPS